MGDGELKDWGLRTKKTSPRAYLFLRRLPLLSEVAYRRSAAGEEVGGEVVELASLEAERFGEEADLDLGGAFTLLP